MCTVKSLSNYLNVNTELLFSQVYGFLVWNPPKRKTPPGGGFLTIKLGGGGCPPWPTRRSPEPTPRQAKSWWPLGVLLGNTIKSQGIDGFWVDHQQCCCTRLLCIFSFIFEGATALDVHVQNIKSGALFGPKKREYPRKTIRRTVGPVVWLLWCAAAEGIFFFDIFPCAQLGFATHLEKERKKKRTLVSDKDMHLANHWMDYRTAQKRKNRTGNAKKFAFDELLVFNSFKNPGSDTLLTWLLQIS